MSDRYERLHETWSEERKSKQLRNIPDTFLHEMKAYVSTLNKTPTDENALGGILTRTEKKNANQMLRELTQLRIRKIVTSEVNGQPLNAQAMTPEEQRLHSNLRQLLLGFTQDTELPKVIESPKKEKAEPKEPPLAEPQRVVDPSEVELIPVRFLESLPAIMGIDMKEYGPFQSEDLASIPLQNARNLIKRGIAKKVNMES